MLTKFIACAAALIAMAQPLANADTPASPPELTKIDADAWLDGFMPYALRQGDIAGAVVAIVKDGQVVTQRGFGYADFAARTPMDPQQTLIRPGSVSKLFTWTAVMQLVEQGKVDLDADVNTYLDFKIPERDGKPITLRNILTHTTGFEEQVRNIMGVAADGVMTLEANVKRWTPKRIFPPGEVPAYSNYATALAGYIVQRVSGLPFDDYVDKNLLEPLGMSHSTFRQPLPEKFRPQLSKGYAVASLPDKPFEIVGPAPAGSLTSTAADMARFMIAHLQDGRFESQQILRPETAKLMHDTTLKILPRVNSMALGFYQADYKGRRVIAHGGDTQWFHSDLRLFLDDGIGLFVSFNSTGKNRVVDDLRTAFADEFADRYLTGGTPSDIGSKQVDEKTAAEHARLLAGSYNMSRRMDSNFLGLLGLLGGVKVIDNRDGTIGVSMVTSPSGVPLKWREVEPFVWRQEHVARFLSAKVADGKVAQFGFEEISPFIVFEPQSAWKSGAWLLPAFVAGFFALLLTGIAWPVSALTRRHYGVAYPLSGMDAKAHRWIRIAAVSAIALWLAWFITTAQMMSDFSLLTGRLDGWLWLLQILALVIFVGGVLIGAWNAWVTLRSRRSWYAKTWSVVVAAAMLVSLWVALVYHLIAFDVNY